MLALTTDKMKTLLLKLSKFAGENTREMLDRKDDPHVFRVHNKRIFYMSEELERRARHFPRKQIFHMGICIGKFTHSGKIHLNITCLPYLARLSKHKIWLKKTGEQSFLYSNHVIKAHVKRITEGAPQNTGVVIYNEDNVALGFGTLAVPTAKLQHTGPESTIAYHQSDISEYLANEELL